ncbi:MAG: hypothetical protein ACD_17C00361G0002 [uncultured bacterium]|nr:MAG: hypothetical protein ACD_17C00361G0002 [uncultured bacterium]OGN55232.1 MAG: hypothetical protein A2796_01510 [Chlamydiae bacterium RIFCSPHIGHO2_01_FULL_44_39]OGN58510.1 MAG: hypothetical protein A3C42_05220 [Chlamydiae bacterium RIFCSPHIGHO2_02_FULL_45_9]OGN59728.1 MAG: hypothetical protein A3D96_03175 [Chlamydiae bacterium RIFCSPHIGHO2_12_FULL_44_59]OGN65811.1 MAG: hypothetical protein A2978_01235 [Chlamydiae bacterium RIFCSPLOWO2_01_FULL_44_52]OGN67988.1 MAG: hypothetical protein A3
MKTIIFRHRRENLKKCSLRGLETHPDLLFYTYPTDSLPDCTGYILLKMGAPPLTIDDHGKGLLLLDGTWRLAKIMEKQLPCHLENKSLPSIYQTAYPRRQSDCPDPAKGLASVEALYIAHQILGKKTEGLLEHYLWKDQFLITLLKVL